MGTGLVIVIALVAVLGIAAAVVAAILNGKRRREVWEAGFRPLEDGVIDAVFQLAPGSWDRVVGRDIELQRAVRIAVEELVGAGIWTAGQVTGALRNLHIIVMPQSAWTDAWGRKVAGLTFAENNCVDVGSDYGALAHEMVEMLLLKLGAAGVHGVNAGNDNWWINYTRLVDACSRYWAKVSAP